MSSSSSSLPLNTVVCGDCVTEMQKLPDNSVDLVIADPPYNISNDNISIEWSEKQWQVQDEDWDADAWDVYQEFVNQWMSEASRVLKPDGTAWVFCSYHNAPYVSLAMRDHGEILNEVIWFKSNAFPNISTTRFTASHETVYWGHLNGDDREYSWLYDRAKELPCPADRFTESDTQIRSVWDISTYKTELERQVDHPTQKPLRVYERILQTTTEPGDVVLVPFTGSGNAALSAKLNDCDFIAYEQNEEYAEQAQKYIDSADEKPSLVEKVTPDTPRGAGES